MPRDRFRHAVVAGASMGGLLAARALADHFERVTLVERDALPREPGPRKGVPQGRHVHVLLVRGHEIIERLFPGITDELHEAGALTLDVGRQLAWHHAGGWRAQFDSDVYLMAQSRPLLEAKVAGRVSALANLTVLDGARVEGVRAEGRAVTGARIARDGRTETIDADLVVDATGRGSDLPRWLESFGFTPPATELIPAPVTYSTCIYPRLEPDAAARALVVTEPAPRRTGLIFPIEGGRSLVSLASLFDEPPPQTRDAFLAFARSLAVPDLHDAIRDLEPLTDIVRHRFPGSRRHRYERLREFPEGLIATGDAVSSFNPLYGQGMTVAALEAEALGRAVARAKAGGGLDEAFARAWHAEAAKIVDLAWTGVAVEDYRFPELAMKAPASLKPLQWYMTRVHRATHRSAAVTDRFYRVVSFLEPPTALMRPRMLADVLLGR